MTITAEQLLGRVKTRCLWPATNAPLPDLTLLELADEEITGSVWPVLIEAQGDYYLASKDYPITAGRARYRMPSRHYGPIKDVVLVDSNGAESPFDMVDIGELAHLTIEGADNPVAYVDGDFIGLWPPPSETDGTLRIRYYRHPNPLTLAAGARRVVDTDFESAPDALGVSSDNAAWVAGTLLDVVSDGNAHQLLADAIEKESGTTSIVFTTEIDELGIEAGDWVVAAGLSPVAQVPDHMIALLIQRVALAAQSAIGDAAAFARTESMLRPLHAMAVNVAEPRTEAEPAIIVPRDSALWSGRRRRW